ncbi:MAG: hypothetical protein E6H59_07970, partial [Betaproteobacteria bacterium]
MSLQSRAPVQSARPAQARHPAHGAVSKAGQTAKLNRRRPTSQRSSCLKTVLAGAALLLAISSAALAQTSLEPNPLATRRGFEVGGQLAHYHYEEPNFAKLIGNRVGVVGAYTFPPRWNRVFFRVDARGSYSMLKYQGSGTQDSVPDVIVEARGVAGLDFFPGNRVSLSPYLGFGYRHLYNDSRGY